MGTRGISAIAGAVLVGVVFEPMTILVNFTYGLFGDLAGSIIRETIKAAAATTTCTVGYAVMLSIPSFLFQNR